MNDIQTDIDRSKELLYASQYTCAICKDDITFVSKMRGVAFLMDLYGKGTRLDAFSAADKVIGKATAMLMVLMGIKVAHAILISIPAAEVFDQYGIVYTYDKMVPHIINREKTGVCPMELAVKEITDPSLAPKAIERALDMLHKNAASK